MTKMTVLLLCFLLMCEEIFSLVFSSPGFLSSEFMNGRERHVHQSQEKMLPL